MALSHLIDSLFAENASHFLRVKKMSFMDLRNGKTSSFLMVKRDIGTKVLRDVYRVASQIADSEKSLYRT